MRTIAVAGLILIAGVSACNSSYTAAPATLPTGTLFSATGDVNVKVTEFRDALGVANGGTAGEQTTGRREINWDGAVANAFDNRDDFPAAFFNTTVKAGSVFTTAGTGFRNDSTLFVDVNPTYNEQFAVLSAKKIFAPVGNNIFDQLFQVAGQPTPAVVRGVGIVFSDVDVANKTTVQLFAQDGTLLATLVAPVRSDVTGLSFVGMTFVDPIIARVRITLGTGPLGATQNDISAGGTKDLVVVDNMIYGEPKHAF